MRRFFLSAWTAIKKAAGRFLDEICYRLMTPRNYRSDPSRLSSQWKKPDRRD